MGIVALESEVRGNPRLGALGVAMHRFIDGEDRMQRTLLPNSLEDYVDAENPSEPYASINRLPQPKPDCIAPSYNAFSTASGRLRGCCPRRLNAFFRAPKRSLAVDD
jgi:hypothetical protein